MKSSKQKNIPDLRTEHTEITLEHCHVLLIKFAKTMSIMEDDPIFEVETANHFDTGLLLRFYTRMFPEVKPFSRLFNSEMGQGVLIGMLVIDLQKEQEEFEDLDG